jgi:hypothetical protein
MGWKSLKLVFDQGAETAQLHLDDLPVLEIGLDNIYRLSAGESVGELLLRGRWTDGQTFVVDYPYPAAGTPTLSELGDTQFQFKFTGGQLDVTVQQLVFGGEPVVFAGTRSSE